MAFNKGFKCPKCGPIPKAKKRQINKVQTETCPDCSSVVSEWEKPLTERDGHCGNCGNASFELAVVDHTLLRCCKACKEVLNPDTKEVKRKGK